MAASKQGKWVEELPPTPDLPRAFKDKGTRLMVPSTFRDQGARLMAPSSDSSRARLVCLGDLTNGNYLFNTLLFLFNNSGSNPDGKGNPHLLNVQLYYAIDSLNCQDFMK